MHRLPFSLSRKFGSQNKEGASGEASASKVTDGQRQTSRAAGNLRSVQPQSDLHQQIDSSITKKRNLELLLRQLQWKKAKLDETVREKEEAAKEVTNAESGLHAKVYEKTQLEKQAQNGKMIVDDLNDAISTLLENINTAKAEHQQVMEDFIERCLELNAKQRELRSQLEDSLLDWTHISCADVPEAEHEQGS